MSEAPLEPEHYTDGELWADDLAAIIDELALERPVLVGLVLRRLRDLRLRPRERRGPNRRRSTSSKALSSSARRLSGRSSARASSITSPARRPTTCRRTSAPCAGSCGPAQRSRWPPRTSRPRCAGTSSCPRRCAPISRPAQLDCDDVLRTLEVPLLVTQGRADTVVLPAMAEHILATCPDRRGVLVRRRRSPPAPARNPTASTGSSPH